MPVSHSPARPRPSPAAGASIARPVSGSALVRAAPGGRPQDAPGSRQDRPTPHRVSMAQRRLRAALLLVALVWMPVSIVLPRSACCSGSRSRSRSSRSSRCSYWLRTEAAGRPRTPRGAGLGPARRDASRPDEHRRGGAAVATRATTPRSSPAPGAGAPAAETAAHHGRERPQEHERADRHDPDERRPGSGPAAPPGGRRVGPPAAYSGVFDVQAAQTGGVPVQPAAAAAEPAPGSWQPRCRCRARPMRSRSRPSRASRRAASRPTCSTPRSLPTRPTSSTSGPGLPAAPSPPPRRDSSPDTGSRALCRLRGTVGLTPESALVERLLELLELVWTRRSAGACRRR